VQIGQTILGISGVLVMQRACGFIVRVCDVKEHVVWLTLGTRCAQLSDDRFGYALNPCTIRSLYGEVASMQYNYCSDGICYVTDYCIGQTDLLHAVLLPTAVRQEWGPDGHPS
jgi:hypothetical protein